MEFGGRTLLEHALELAGTVASQVVVVGDHTRYGSFGKAVADVFTGRGPLGGIHAALVHSNAAWNLIMGVDLPFLKAEFLRFLIDRARLSDALVAVPYVAGRFQPLCGVYRKEFASNAEAALSKGNNQVHALFADVALRTIDEHEIVEAGFSTAMFRNVNTPADFEAALRELG